MMEFFGLILIAALISSIIWAAILFVLSPTLMGNAAPASAIRLQSIFLSQHHRNIKFIQIAYTDSHIALATALMTAPCIVDLTINDNAIHYYVQTNFTSTNNTVQVRLVP